VPPERLEESIPRIIRSPLRIAQWYDYWPGSVLADFVAFVQSTYGVTIDLVQEPFSSNEELYYKMVQSGSTYDVVFPTQGTLERLKIEGRLRPLDPDLLPNLANLFPEYQRPAFATDRRGNLFAAAYMAGTTGLAFRTDKGWTTADAEGVGWDLLWLTAFQGTDLNQKAMALAEMRDLLGMGIKKAGYDATGLAIVSEGQWSLNTRDLSQLGSAVSALQAAKPHWYGIGPTNPGSYLESGTLYAAQMWSVDALYVIRPYLSNPNPIDYILPKQGFPRWVDSACIPASSDNVFLAHVFIDYLLRADVALAIARWNLGGTTPNAAAYDLLTALPPSNWDPRQDPRVYPDSTTLARSEYARALPASVMAEYEGAYWQLLSS